MTPWQQAVAAAQNRERGSFYYSGEHCSKCGSYVGPDRWGDLPEYGSHGCLWDNDAKVVRVARAIGSSESLP